MAEQERRLREEEAAAAREGKGSSRTRRGTTPPNDKEGLSPSKQRARGEDGPREPGRKPRVQMLRELLQTEGWY